MFVLSTSPIAVLDSGAGGLSVVNALRTLMPHEEIHYFADTAHLPYGTKSPELINYLALKMARRLHELSQCKVVVVACHTISTWCLAQISQALKIPVIGMVEPSIAGLRCVVRNRPHIRSVGIISTKATILSRAYQRAWPSIDPQGNIALFEQPSGPLVSLVEEPDIDFRSITSLVGQFLSSAIKESDAVLIGCTHFNALVPVLTQVLKPSCHIVDSAIFAAHSTRDVLDAHNQHNPHREKKTVVAYVSDNPERFQIIARRFIEENLIIEWLRKYVQS
jgi:glutamate racemase